MKNKNVILHYDPEDSVSQYCEDFRLDSHPTLNPVYVINRALCTQGASIVFHHPEDLYLAHFALNKPSFAKITSWTESEILHNYVTIPKTMRLLTNDLNCYDRCDIKQTDSLFAVTSATMAIILDKAAGNINLLSHEEQVIFTSLLQTLKNYIANYLYIAICYNTDKKFLNVFVHANTSRSCYTQ